MPERKVPLKMFFRWWSCTFFLSVLKDRGGTNRVFGKPCFCPLPKRRRFLTKAAKMTNFLGPIFSRTDFARIFFFWAAGFFRGFCRRIFSPFCGKKCPEKSSRKIPGKILQKLYKKNPRHISAEGPGQNFAFYPLKARASLFRPPRTTKMAGFTQAKAWFRKRPGLFFSVLRSVLLLGHIGVHPILEKCPLPTEASGGGSMKCGNATVERAKACSCSPSTTWIRQKYHFPQNITYPNN